MEPDDRLDPPQATRDDLQHAAMRGAISAIPWVGGAAAEIVSHFFGPPLTRRTEQWQAAVAQALRELRDRGVDMESLRNSDEFVDVVTQASRIALQTSSEEKKQALLNAIRNAATAASTDVAEQQWCLYLLDALTEWHVRILHLMRDPRKWIAEHGAVVPVGGIGAISTLMENCFPGLRGRRDFYTQIWRDLFSRGLINTESMHTTMTGDGMVASRTTAIANIFVKFISS